MSRGKGKRARVQAGMKIKELQRCRAWAGAAVLLLQDGLAAAVLPADSPWQRLPAGGSSSRGQGCSAPPPGICRSFAETQTWARAAGPPSASGSGQGRLSGLFHREVASWKEQKAQGEVSEKRARRTDLW